MLRFSPSLSAEMPLSNLRVAIFNYILSKQLKEDLIIIIEDADKKRYSEGMDKDILNILSLFSMDYKGVVYQSDNLKYQQKMAMQLMASKKAFSCFCSDEKLQELKDETKKEGKIYSYDGFCATLSDETVLNCNAPFTVRITKPNDNIQFNDDLKGKLEFTPDEVDAFFILNHDKSPTSNYATAVDDMLYNISYVISEDEKLCDTPRQIHVRQMLGYDKEIHYTHIPNVDADITVNKLVDEGYLPSAIANYLVSLSTNAPTDIFSLEDAIEWFDIKTIDQSSVKFDLKALQLINKKHLEDIDDMRLSKILGFADADIGKLGKLFLEDVFTIKEIKENIDAIFNPKAPLEGFTDEFNKLQSILKGAAYFDEFDGLKAYVKEESKLDDNTIEKLLRYIITGKQSGPDMKSIYGYIKNYLGEIVK